MSARRKRNRKRSRPSPNKDTKDIAPPSKKQKISANIQTQPKTPTTNNIIPNNTPITNNTSITPKSATPPPPSRSTSHITEPNTSPLEPHEEEEKAQETSHAIHLDSPTPKEPNTNITSEPIPKLNIDNALGHLMNLKQNATLNKRNVVSQLTEMSKKPGGIPTDLQRQLNEYYHRKKHIDNHIKKRVSDIYNRNANRNNNNNNIPYATVPKPQCQPIITTNICCDTFKDENDEFDTEESWNCNVIICCVFAIIFIMCLFILNMRVWNNNIMYCNSNYNGNNTIECTDCPMHAICENGIAQCEDNEYKLHPIKGCLPKDMYYKRINGETLYTQIYEYLKYRRRQYVSCNKSIRYELSENEMREFFVKDKRNSQWSENELDEAVDEFGRILLEEKFANEINKNYSSGMYFAGLAEWEIKSSENCTKMNILLMARTYGLELMVSVVCVAALLVAWRQLSI